MSIGSVDCEEREEESVWEYDGLLGANKDQSKANQSWMLRESHWRFPWNPGSILNQ